MPALTVTPAQAQPLLEAFRPLREDIQYRSMAAEVKEAFAAGLDQASPMQHARQMNGMVIHAFEGIIARLEAMQNPDTQENPPSIAEIHTAYRLLADKLSDGPYAIILQQAKTAMEAAIGPDPTEPSATARLSAAVRRASSKGGEPLLDR